MSKEEKYLVGDIDVRDSTTNENEETTTKRRSANKNKGMSTIKKIVAIAAAVGSVAAGAGVASMMMNNDGGDTPPTPITPEPNPVDPINPDPIDPVGPSDPDPVDPVRPSDPDPVDPVGPSNPDPVDPPTAKVYTIILDKNLDGANGGTDIIEQIHKDSVVDFTKLALPSKSNVTVNGVTTEYIFLGWTLSDGDDNESTNTIFFNANAEYFDENGQSIRSYEKLPINDSNLLVFRNNGCFDSATKTITLHACWQEKVIENTTNPEEPTNPEDPEQTTVYRLSYDVNVSRDGPPDLKLSYGDTFKLSNVVPHVKNTPNRYNPNTYFEYTFVGWTSEEYNQDTMLEPDATYTLDENLPFYKYETVTKNVKYITYTVYALYSEEEKTYENGNVTNSKMVSVPYDYNNVSEKNNDTQTSIMIK